MQYLLFLTFCIQILVRLAKFVDQDECKTFACSFESGDFCNYESKIYRNSDQRVISSWKIFTSQSRGLKNPRSPTKNVNRYAAAVVSSQQTAVLETGRNTNARLLRHRFAKFRQSDVRVIKFKYFITSPDVNIFVCCNDVSNCPYSTPRMRQPVFYRWHRSSFECKEKLEKILFYVTTTKSSRPKTKSLVAIDDIQVFYSKSHPEYWKAGFNVCEARYVTTTSTASSKKAMLPIRTTVLRRYYTAEMHSFSATTTPTVDTEDDDYEIVILPKDWNQESTI